jgi:hypothetical protein
MPEQKYVPEQWHWPELDAKWWFKAWNHWLNPLGNWHEPMPFPQKRADEALDSRLHHWFGTFGVWLWWTLRNPLHNAKHFLLGITPHSERYVWHIPEETGWMQYEEAKDLGWAEIHVSLWRKPRRPTLPTWNLYVGGWQIGLGWDDDGGFSGSFRRHG